MNEKIKGEEKKLHIGKVTGTVGLRGEIKIFHFADDPSQLKACNSLLMADREYNVKSIRYKKKIPVIKLDGLDSIEDAEAVKDMDIYIDPDQLPQLPDDSYYIKDLMGLKVVSHADGSYIGIINDVISSAAQDVYEIKTVDGKKILVPAVSRFIIDVDTEANQMKVTLPEGIEDIKY